MFLSFEGPQDYVRFADIVAPAIEAETSLTDWICTPMGGSWFTTVVFPYRHLEDVVEQLTTVASEPYNSWRWWLRCCRRLRAPQ